MVCIVEKVAEDYMVSDFLRLANDKNNLVQMARKAEMVEKEIFNNVDENFAELIEAFQRDFNLVIHDDV